MEETVIRERRDGAEPSTIWLLAALLYFLLAASTIHLTSDGRTIATVWPANAVLVAFLLLGRLPRWKLILSAGLAGNLAANWLTRGTISGPLLYSIANGVEVAVAVALIRSNLGRFDLLRSTSVLFRFLFAAGLVAPALSALLGGLTAALVYNQAFQSAFATWFISDSLGLLVFTPVLRAILGGQVTLCFASKSPKKRVEAALMMMMTTASAYAVFYVASFPALFLLYAPIMVVTFRVGPLGTKMAVMVVAVIGAIATATGHGPIVMTTADPVDQAYLFQASLAVMLLTCLPVAAEVSERNRLTAELAGRAQEAVVDATTDTLTGILNRRGFERAVTTLLAQTIDPVCCVAIDVDRFKGINDRWGHQFGDEVLKHLASVLRSNTRPGDVVGRLGGDEFMMILRVGNHEAGETVCARIQNTLRQAPLSPDDQTKLMVSISCGVAPAVSGETFAATVKRADQALYEAKNGGRNTFRSASRASRFP